MKKQIPTLLLQTSDRHATLLFVRNFLWLTISMLVTSFSAYAQVASWEKWEQNLTSNKSYPDPYKDVTIQVTYNGPNGQSFSTYGFWDGGNIHKIRCAFPSAGSWTWSTTCSDNTNSGLHNKKGTVNVSAYTGTNPLYKHGFLKVSTSKRHLAYDDGTPFLWMGNTVWTLQDASLANWQTFIDNQAAKNFSVVQISPYAEWGKNGQLNTKGESPWATEFSRINPVFWKTLEEKIYFANSKGIVVMLVGLPGWQQSISNSSDTETFIRQLVGRFYSSFVMFSPSADQDFTSYNDNVGNLVNLTTTRHLIAQHIATSLTAAKNYQVKPYVDFKGMQSGHCWGNVSTTRANAINWILDLYDDNPVKPIINLEAFYHGDPAATEAKYHGTAADARALGYLSWLSGSLGYTYGALGNWKWDAPPGGVTRTWSDAMNLNSGMHMKYLTQLFAGIQWWKLEPAHSLIKNQTSDNITKMVLAKSSTGDLGVAYLPDNTTIQIDMSGFSGPMKVRWYNPVNGVFTAISGSPFSNSGIRTYTRPGAGDWVLLLVSDNPTSKNEIVSDNEVFFSCYPNPGQGIFTIEYKGADKNIVLTVTDITGKSARSVEYKNTAAGFIEQIDLRQIPDGIYIIKLKTENEIKTIKLIKKP